MSQSNEDKKFNANSTSNSNSNSNSNNMMGPYDDRVMKDVIAPPLVSLTKEKCLDKNGMPNLTVLREHLIKEGRLEYDLARHLILSATSMFKAEANILELRYPITVCGD